MKIEILGRRNVEFVNQQTGELVQGVSLYFLRPDENVTGLCPDKIFVKKSRSDYEEVVKFPIPCTTEVEFFKGRLSSINLIKG